jgi:hypothetical protein
MAFGWLNIIWVWLQQLVMLPANLAKVSGINKDLKLQQELSETQQRLEKAENKLAKYAAIEAGRLFFDKNVYWAKDAEGKIDATPYCPRCFDLDGQPVRLIPRRESGRRFAECPECKVKKIPLWNVRE